MVVASRWRRQWHPTPALLPGKSHGRRSLVGYSPWGHEESDTTERPHFHFSLSCIGEGNGNPLQCSCLENPRDGGAWWPAVYGVAQSWTRLKRLSSSSSSSSSSSLRSSLNLIFLKLDFILEIFEMIHSSYMKIKYFQNKKILGYTFKENNVPWKFSHSFIYLFRINYVPCSCIRLRK